MNPDYKATLLRVRIVLSLFITLLVLSGATAIPVEEQLQWYLGRFSNSTAIGRLFTTVLQAVTDTRSKYPFLMYGYDWLAFAHFVIAVAFIGPLKNPVKNIWVIQFGIIACLMVLPYAMVFGALRGLPWWWRLIDCCFGIFGILPLWYCYRQTKKLEALQQHERLNLVF